MNMHIRTERRPKAPIGRVDWLQNALLLMISEGIDAVQITRLSRTMDMTRGSFYWHFESRAELLSAILKEWKAANGKFFKEHLSGYNSLDESILAFFGIWVEESRFSPELDQAVRDWARLDSKVLRKVRKEDNRRLKDLARVFRRFNFTDEEANVRARVLYFSQVGYTAINLGEAMNERLALLDSYFFAYTGRKLDRKVANRFAKQMQAHVQKAI